MTITRRRHQKVAASCLTPVDLHLRLFHIRICAGVFAQHFLKTGSSQNCPYWLFYLQQPHGSPHLKSYSIDLLVVVTSYNPPAQGL